MSTAKHLYANVRFIKEETTDLDSRADGTGAESDGIVGRNGYNGDSTVRYEYGRITSIIIARHHFNTFTIKIR